MNQRFVLLLSATAALGGLLFGFDTAVIAGAIPGISECFNLDAKSLGWAVGSGLVGCAIGSILAGWYADRFGRKAVLLVCAVLFAISGIGAGLSVSLTEFVCFRIIGGLGVGAAAMVSPMYIAEIAPASARGKLVSLYQLAIVTGILLAYFVNYAMDDWRWMFASQAFPSLLFFLSLCRVPETPRWLVRNGRSAEAIIVLMKIDPGLVVADIENSFEKQAMGGFNRALLVGISLAVFQQITGINAILYYAPAIFNSTGFTVLIGIVNLVATFVAIAFVDKLGRRQLLLWGSALMTGSLLVVAYASPIWQKIFVLLDVAGFGCTLGAVTWVYLSEIFPNRVRAMALSMATFALWVADFVVSYSFPILNERLGLGGTLELFAGMCLFSFVFVYLTVKETKGKTLEEIESLFI